MIKSEEMPRSYFCLSTPATSRRLAPVRTGVLAFALLVGFCAAAWAQARRQPELQPQPATEPPPPTQPQPSVEPRLPAPPPPCLDVISAPSRFRTSLPRISWGQVKSLKSIKTDLEKAGELGGVPVVSKVEVYSDQDVCPLTSAKKFDLFLRDAYSPLIVLSAGFNAAISQAQEGRSGYGQGWDAYGSRFGAEVAGTEVSGLLQTAVIPSLAHEDPRFFRAGHGPIPARFWYAATRVAVARKDSGGHRFNYSEILGVMLSAAASNAWAPDTSRTFNRTFTSAGVGIGSDAGWDVVKEFAPDIWRRLTHQPKKPPPPPTPPPQTSIPLRNPADPPPSPAPVPGQSAEKP